MWGVGSAGMNIAAYLGSSNYSAGMYSGATFAAGMTSNYNPGTGAVAQNDVIALAVDFTAGKIWLAKNGVWVNSSNPATGSLPIVSFTTATVGALFAGISFDANEPGPSSRLPPARNTFPRPAFRHGTAGL